MRKIYSIALIFGLSIVVSTAFAQQVATLYFLENAPMRHIVNPAFQPVSDGYVAITPLGYTSLWVGNNSVTMSDIIFKKHGMTVTAVHPDANPRDLLRAIRGTTSFDTDMTLNILSFGWRNKKDQNGYIHIGIQERIEAGVGMPKEYFDFLLGGGMHNLLGNNHYDLRTTGFRMSAYTEISGGYSYQLNDEWTIGGKLKFLLGIAYADMKNNKLVLDASVDGWHLYGNGSITIAAPINYGVLPDPISYDAIKNIKVQDLIDGRSITDFLTPSGYGAAIDFGFAYKPHPQVQITAAINDLGFIVWNTGSDYRTRIDSTFTGVNGLNYSDYSNVGNGHKFDSNKLKDDVVNSLEKFAQSITSDPARVGFTRMLSAKLNVGVDANFCDNIIGLGILSKTRLFNNRLYEEVTLGFAVRPVNWFNMALSYSLVQNGKYSNIGAGLSFMPYDGINMTLAMDYIPTSYVYAGNQKNIPIPYRAKGVNVALGFTVVWGTNHDKDIDKDGVWNQFDVCPLTPPNVKVDELGCPLDSDGDGIPDYLDNCPDTPQEAYGLTDSVGCPLDTDGDGVPDYKDLCPNTPIEAYGFVDEFGCELDTDGDGVPDWRDLCPNTPKEAYGFVDENGCEIDTDGDGVPDWKDRCPDTPEAAWGYIDEYGCPKDTDGDGVPDYLDDCPTQPGPAYNKGCPEIKKEVRNLLNKAMQGIKFETGKATIKKVSFPLLNKIAAIFIENTNYIIEVQGHTDNVGKADYNMRLSDARANSVMNYLINQGVPADRMSAHGYGLTRPMADNSTKEGRALNRRVEFNITFEEVHYETILNHIDSTLYQQHLDSIRAIEMVKDSVQTQQVTE